MNKYYLIDDTKKTPGVIYVKNKKDALSMNKEGYGVFWTVNSFKTDVRRESNLESLDYWYVDIDTDSKKTQLELLNKYLPPSLVVETKNGHHAYWKTLDLNIESDRRSTIYNYKKQLHNLVHYFNGDPNATDVSRILRVPFFKHMKNPDAPFVCKCVVENNFSYTANQMRCAFPSPKLTYKVEIPKEILPPSGDSIFERAASMNCINALEKLSGTMAVSGEAITFRATRRGRNIYINGKSTSCWVDREGLIGSKDKGGPTINQWLYWYHKSWSSVANILEEYFPELRSDK